MLKKPKTIDSYLSVEIKSEKFVEEESKVGFFIIIIKINTLEKLTIKNKKICLMFSMYQTR